MNPEIVGYIAAAVCVTAFLPQAWKVFKTRDTKDLSTAMWIFEIIGFGLWIWYGLLLDKLPITIPNAICAVLSMFILGMKLTESRRSSGRSARHSRPEPPFRPTSPREMSHPAANRPAAASR